MTPLEAKEILIDSLPSKSVNSSPLSPFGEAIEAAIKFIEENYSEWAKIEGPETLPGQYDDIMLCYKVQGSDSFQYCTAHTFYHNGDIFWNLDNGDMRVTPIAWRPLQKQMEYQP